MEPWFRVAVMIVVSFVVLFFKRDLTGHDRIPTSGPVILAANHVSYVDPFVLAYFVYRAGRRPRYLAKSSLFRIPLIGRILRGAGQIPVERNTADAAHALDAAVDAVRRGECVVIYPEGTVTKDPAYWPMAARTGVARLALLSGAPVIPVGQWGAQDFLPLKGKARPFPRKTVHLRVGDPVDLSAWRDAPLTTQTLRDVTAHVMAAVTELVAELRDEPVPAEVFDVKRSA